MVFEEGRTGEAFDKVQNRRCYKGTPAVTTGRKATVIIVCDGVNGCGKSTITKMIVRALKAQGREAVLFREPGSTNVAEIVRKLLKDPAYKIRSVWTELMLFEACRSELWAEIEDKREAGVDVVLDRWWFSTYAYQGCRGVPASFITELHKSSAFSNWVEPLNPKLCFWLNCDPELASHRRAGVGSDVKDDRFEREGLELARKLHSGYRKLWVRGYMSAIEINERDTVDDVFRRVWSSICRAVEEETEWPETNCPECRGLGRADADVPCPVCHGQGKVARPEYWDYKRIKGVPGGICCPACYGTGYQLSETSPPTVSACGLCDASGRVVPGAATEWKRLQSRILCPVCSGANSESCELCAGARCTSRGRLLEYEQHSLGTLLSGENR